MKAGQNRVLAKLGERPGFYFPPFSPVFSIFTVAPIALADDSDYSSLIPDGVERTPEGFEKELDKAFETRTLILTVLPYVFSRMFSTGYMNDVRGGG